MGPRCFRRGHDTLVVRQTVDAGWTAPVNGTTYNRRPLGSTVVYRGPLRPSTIPPAPSTTYYYRFYSENWSYYSVAYGTTKTAGRASPLTGNWRLAGDAVGHAQFGD